MLGQLSVLNMTARVSAISVSIFLCYYFVQGVRGTILYHRRALEKGEHRGTAETKQCPQCAEQIRIEASACRFCGYEFSTEDFAPVRRYQELRASIQADEQTAKQLRRSIRVDTAVGSLFMVPGVLIGMVSAVGIVTGSGARGTFLIFLFVSALLIAPGLAYARRNKARNADLNALDARVASANSEADAIQQTRKIAGAVGNAILGPQASPSGGGAQEPAAAGNQPAQGPSPWGAAAGAGVVGGAIAGLLASSGDGKLGFGAFVVFMLMMMGINGGGRKTLAMVLFPAVAALVIAILKK